MSSESPALPPEKVLGNPRVVPAARRKYWEELPPEQAQALVEWYLAEAQRSPAMPTDPALVYEIRCRGENLARLVFRCVASGEVDGPAVRESMRHILTDPMTKTDGCPYPLGSDRAFLDP